MRRFSLIPMILLVPGLLLLACDDTGGGDTEQAPAGVDVAKSALERDANPDVPAADLAALVEGNSAFAFDMYALLAAEEGNLVFSPHSISVALAMAYAGAENSTETQMADALSFDLPEAALHPAFNKLDLLLSSRGEGAMGKDGEPFRLRVVNAAWAQDGYPFLASYLDVLGLNYGAGVNLMDFGKDPEGCRGTINDWVSEQTETRIPELLPEGSIQSLTRLVLTNAVYFNASWKYQFDEDLTADAPFTRLDGSVVQAPTMVQTEGFRFARTAGFDAVEMPYDGDEIAILMVTTDGDFSTFEAGLDEVLLAQVDAALGYGDVEVHLPKFEYRKKAGLVSHFQALGMNDAFAPGAADLSGIDGGRELFISNILHEAFILLDETGTEAAAATAVIIGVTSVPPPPTPIHFDKPFVYFIRDVETGAILFVGRVVDPTA